MATVRYSRLLHAPPFVESSPAGSRPLPSYIPPSLSEVAGHSDLTSQANPVACLSRSVMTRKKLKTKAEDLFAVPDLPANRPGASQPRKPPPVPARSGRPRSRLSPASSSPGSPLTESQLNALIPRFPGWAELPAGLDPVMSTPSSPEAPLHALDMIRSSPGMATFQHNLMWRENTEPLPNDDYQAGAMHDLVLALCEQRQLLFLDDLGYEDELQILYEEQENLSQPENSLSEDDMPPLSILIVRMTREKPTSARLLQVDLARSIIWIEENKKGKVKRTFSPDAVTEIRFGPKTKVFEQAHVKSLLGHYIPVVLCATSTVNFLIPASEHSLRWMARLVHYISLIKNGDQGDSLKSLATSLWHTHFSPEDDVPRKRSGSGVRERKFPPSRYKKYRVSDICKAVDLQISSSVASKSVLVGSYDEFTEEELEGMLRAIRHRPEIDKLFAEYALSDPSWMTVHEFIYFLQDQQQQGEYTASNIQLLLTELREDGAQGRDGLSKEEFYRFMNSPLNSVFRPYMLRVYQDMTRPLTDYFINSSHNTYLEGNQLSSYSSSEMYVRVLKAGCRCVELDCWNGDRGEPIIFHGGTLTSRILFEDVVRSIAEYAFVASPYPVILSLENHCNIEQQTRMARIMVEHFGEMIAEPLWKNEANFRELRYLPSPLELQRKILIKGKISSLFSTAPNSNVVAPELEAITYLVSVGCSDLPAFLHKQPRVPWEIVSFVETRLDQMALPNADFIEFNHRNFSRVYPKGTRVESSNYKPHPWWCGGSQLVALNLQTRETHSWTNDGLFRDNGGCGYVLKPFYQRSNYLFPFDPTHPAPFHPLHLTVTVLSGRQLPGNPNRSGNVSPYVKMTIMGYPADQTKQRTHSISNNGFSPTWNKSLSFHIDMPEVAVLVIQVCDQVGPKIAGSQRVLAYYSLPLSCVQMGYRVIPLYDPHGGKLPMSDLFCRFSIDHKDV